MTGPATWVWGRIISLKAEVTYKKALDKQSDVDYDSIINLLDHLAADLEDL